MRPDILRTQLQQSRVQGDSKGACVANLSYVYNHHERDLSERLANIQHAHLDHEQCIESGMLKGPVAQGSSVRR